MLNDKNKFKISKQNDASLAFFFNQHGIPAMIPPMEDDFTGKDLIVRNLSIDTKYPNKSYNEVYEIDGDDYHADYILYLKGFATNPTDSNTLEYWLFRRDYLREWIHCHSNLVTSLESIKRASGFVPKRMIYNADWNKELEDINLRHPGACLHSKDLNDLIEYFKAVEITEAI